MMTNHVAYTVCSEWSSTQPRVYCRNWPINRQDESFVVVYRVACSTVPSVCNSLPASAIGSDSLSVSKSRLLKHTHFVGPLSSTHNRLSPAPLVLTTLRRFTNMLIISSSSSSSSMSILMRTGSDLWASLNELERLHLGVITFTPHVEIDRDGFGLYHGPIMHGAASPRYSFTASGVERKLRTSAMLAVPSQHQYYVTAARAWTACVIAACSK